MRRLFTLLFGLMVVASGCSSDSQSPTTDNLPDNSGIRLYDIMPKGSAFGQTVSDEFLYRYGESINYAGLNDLPRPHDLEDYPTRAWLIENQLVRQHSNALSAENALKWHKHCQTSTTASLLPNCDFTDPQKPSFAQLFLHYAQSLASERDITVVLHAPVWPEKLNANDNLSFCQRGNGDYLNRDSVNEKIQLWFQAVAGLIQPYTQTSRLHFELDALNEFFGKDERIILDDETQTEKTVYIPTLKPFCFGQVEGLEAAALPAMVFGAARKAMSELTVPVKLLYNDFNMVDRSKADGVTCMAKSLHGLENDDNCVIRFPTVENGHLIDGVSWQAHWTYTYPRFLPATNDAAEPRPLDLVIERYRELKRLLGIDINISEFDMRATSNICEAFAQPLKTFSQNSDVFDRFSIWGVSEAKKAYTSPDKDYLQLFLADGQPRISLTSLQQLFANPDSVNLEDLCPSINPAQ